MLRRRRGGGICCLARDGNGGPAGGGVSKGATVVQPYGEEPMPPPSPPSSPPSDHASPTTSAATAISPLAWTIKSQLFYTMQATRCVMLSIVLASVPLFVLQDKSDAVSISLNTVAALFILELDNILFTFLLGERACNAIAETDLTVPAGYALRAEVGEKLVFVVALVMCCMMPIAQSMGITYLTTLGWVFGASCFLADLMLQASLLEALACAGRHAFSWLVVHQSVVLNWYLATSVTYPQFD
jgi:hypothetical protein